MTISHTEEIIQKVIKYSQELYQNSQRALLKFWKLSPFTNSTGSTSRTDSVQVFAGIANINIKFAKLLPKTSELTQLAKTELLWWIENLRVLNGKSLRLQEPHLLNQANASTEDWGAHCSGILTGGIWLSEEPVFHINSLEL